MDTQEKKILFPVIKTYGDDLSHRWRIEWDVPICNGLKFKCKVLYGGINRGKTVDERIAYANNLIQKLLTNQCSLKGEKDTLADNFDKVVQLNTINWRPSSLRVYKTVLSVFRVYLGSADFP